MSLIHLRPAGQRGDTIVEVLIAIAVLSSVLGIAYSIMNQNIGAMRDNQERSEATKLAQGQVEALKLLSSTRQADILAIGDSSFCIIGSNLENPADSSIPYADPTAEDLSQYAPCIDSSGLFHYVIKRDNADPTNKLYRAFVRWDALGGYRGEVMMAYRIP